ncbi:helix-turn-helix transcriptional regulator [Paenibacillus oceani]|uniref:helix-turn-helix transcriptional regulator n=1 Tax=Paenibacillus oceani TaxID=2772510 RepID=UPI00168A3892|nr:AraC family transcriptional regulator [Paenibacillus oceani]
MIFEHCSYLNHNPITIVIGKDASRTFQPLFHFHPGIEIIFVHNGEGSVIFEHGAYEVKPGTLLFIKPFQPHYLQMRISSGTPYVRSLLKYEKGYFTEYLKAFPDLQKFHDHLCSDSDVVQVQQVPEHERLVKFMVESNERLLLHPTHTQMEGRALLLASVLHYLYPLWRKDGAAKQPAVTKAPAVSGVMKWIEENYDKEFELDVLAQAVHLSPNHVSQLFRKVTGKTIIEWLTERRMKQACILLKTTTRSVQEIGEKSGWPNFNYFCYIFKKRMGMTPKQYRYH